VELLIGDMIMEKNVDGGLKRMAFAKSDRVRLAVESRDYYTGARSVGQKMWLRVESGRGFRDDGRKGQEGNSWGGGGKLLQCRWGCRPSDLQAKGVEQFCFVLIRPSGSRPQLSPGNEPGPTEWLGNPQPHDDLPAGGSPFDSGTAAGLLSFKRAVRTIAHVLQKHHHFFCASIELGGRWRGGVTAVVLVPGKYSRA
jgi:hypothetical protein